MTKKSKIFWVWVTLEVVATAWVGIEIARATEKPWARQPKASKLPGGR